MNKNYLFSITFFLLCFTIFAQAPSNDNPENAIELTVGSVFLDNDVEGTFVNATDSQELNANIPDPDCGNSDSADVWYTATVGVNGLMTIQTDDSVAASDLDTVLEVYSGADVNSLSLIDCNDDGGGNGFFSSVTLSDRTPGEVLYIRVLELNNDSGTFQIAAYSPMPPSNDEPETAISLVVGTTYDENKIEGSNEGATDSAIANTSIPVPDCGSYQGADVWFTATASAIGSLIIETDASSFAVYSGASENALVLEGCEQFSDQISLTGRTPGEVLYIRVWATGNSFVDNFEISAYAPDPPVNDDPAGATTLIPGATFLSAKITGTNVAATDSPNINSSCGIFYDGGDIWYTVTVGSNESVYIETNRDGLGVALYSGTANNLVEEESCRFFENPFVFEDRTEGETLFVRVFDIGNNDFSSFEIAAISAEFIENDSPESAINLPVGIDFDTNTLEVSDFGATDSPIDEPSCGFSFGNDIWFSVEVGSTGAISVETEAIEGSQVLNTDMAIYSGTPDALVEEDCNESKDPFDFFETFSKVDLTGRTEGEVLYVRVWVPSFGAMTSSDLFKIAAYDGEGQTLNTNNFNEESLSLYPNPASHSFTISSKETLENIKLYNLKGQKVLELKNLKINEKVDISALPSGVYLIKSMSKGKLSRGRVLKF